MDSNLTVIFELDEDGWWIATIPEIPGAFSQGKTQSEARENVVDALHELMAARREMALRSRRSDSAVETLSLTAP